MRNLFIPLIMTVLMFTSGCIPFVNLSTVHPDSDKEITFNVTEGSTQGTVTEMQLEIEGSVVATQPGTSLTYTGGPYAPYSNMKMNYRGIAVKSTGSTASNSGWVYVVNPKNVYTYIAPSGSNNGYPNSTAEQTGANLYRLDKQIVRQTAQVALLEFANFRGTSINNIDDIADSLVAAVAYYVDWHMSWRKDSLNRIVFANNGWSSYTPGWDFPQPADLTLTISGDLTNASPHDDYMGDCEDHAILRAALLRALGFAPWGIWDAIDYQPDADRHITHEYNVVLFEGAYRLMDYGLIQRWLESHTWNSHMTHFGWNEEHGPRGATTTNHNYLVNFADNFPGGKDCPGDWSYLIYYRNRCR
jgi:hypothetical protein